MWEPVALDGRQFVQVAARVRAVGIKAIPRGNEQHTLTYTKCVETAGIADAAKAVLNHAKNLPLGMAAVTVTFADATVFTLADAAVEAWGGGQTEHLARLSTRIIGGALT